MNHTTSGFIYVIQAENFQRYKIGFSKHPEQRIAQLQTGSPFKLNLIASWPGTERQEKQIHFNLSHCRQAGEWFEIASLDLIKLQSIKAKREKPEKDGKMKVLYRKKDGLTYAVDPIKISRNTWRIRIRCRRSKCKHEDHRSIFTVSLMSNSAFNSVRRNQKDYAPWKRSIIAENAKKFNPGCLSQMAEQMEVSDAS